MKSTELQELGRQIFVPWGNPILGIKGNQDASIPELNFPHAGTHTADLVQAPEGTRGVALGSPLVEEAKNPLWDTAQVGDGFKKPSQIVFYSRLLKA